MLRCRKVQAFYYEYSLEHEREKEEVLTEYASGLRGVTFHLHSLIKEFE